MERSRTTKVQPVRYIDGVELPAQGSWPAPRSQPVAISVRRGIRRNRGAGRVIGGSLDIGRQLAATTLTLEIHGPNGVMRLRAAAIEAGADGRWRFTGSLERDGAVAPISARAVFHGVFRSGDAYVAWFTVDVDCRHSAGRTQLGCELNFSAPTPESSAARSGHDARLAA